MVNRKAFEIAVKKIEENKKRKKTPEEKAQETRMYTQRLAEMRAYICKSEEKRQLLLDTINSYTPDNVISYWYNEAPFNEIKELPTSNTPILTWLHNIPEENDLNKVIEWFRSTPFDEKTTTLEDFILHIPNFNEVRMWLHKIPLANKNDHIPTLLEKGVIIYVEFLEAIDLICKDLEDHNIQYMYVTGEVSTKGRGKVCDWFKEDASNKVIIISSAGGESLNLNFTNELILYSTPKGYAKFVQVIGRVDRSFGKYNHFNIHFIEVEDTTDTYEQILLSSRKELEMELLTQDTIPVKETMSFDQKVLKEFRKYYLWKERVTKPKIRKN